MATSTHSVRGTGARPSHVLRSSQEEARKKEPPRRGPGRDRALIGDSELKVAKAYDMLPEDAGNAAHGRAPPITRPFARWRRILGRPGKWRASPRSCARSTGAAPPSCWSSRSSRSPSRSPTGSTHGSGAHPVRGDTRSIARRSRHPAALPGRLARPKVSPKAPSHSPASRHRARPVASTQGRQFVTCSVALRRRTGREMALEAADRQGPHCGTSDAFPIIGGNSTCIGCD